MIQKISILILLFSTSIFGQEIKFPVLDAAWCYYEYLDDGTNRGKFCYAYADSLVEINGKEYSVLKTPNLWNLPEVHYLREEENKVYLNLLDVESEILLYDFNLEVGDKFKATYGFGLNEPAELEVLRIENMIMDDGSIRKSYTLESQDPFQRIEWIEGIGDRWWLFFYPAYRGSVSGGFGFNCFRIGDQVIYNPSSRLSDCMIMADEELVEDSDIKIFPNPTSGEINLTFGKSDIESYQITNIYGNIVHHKKMDPAENSCKAIVAETGLYVLTLKMKNGNLGYRKILVTK